eukprot:926344-Heterocapsa_arctica.AAC.1
MPMIAFANRRQAGGEVQEERADDRVLGKVASRRRGPGRTAFTTTLCRPSAPWRRPMTASAARRRGPQ